MAVVRSLQQQNQAMGAEMRDMRAQMHEERLERRRYLNTMQAEGLNCTPHPWNVVPPSGSGSRGMKKLTRVRLDILGSTPEQVMRGYKMAARRGVSNQ